MIGVLGAMDAEIEAIVDRMEMSSEYRWGVTRVRLGRFGGTDICCARTGVGKAMAAATASRLLCVHRLDALLYVGIAGALDDSLEIGDIVVATATIQHDLDATVFGFHRGEVPYDGIRWLASDERLLEAAKRFVPGDAKLVTGPILTGDQFCSAKDREHLRYLSDELGGVAIEMEGAAAALAARLEGVPFLSARVVSDKANGAAPGDFSAFLPAAADRIARFVEDMLGKL